MKKKILILLTALLLFAVVLSACGKKSDDDSDKNASTEEPSTTVSAEADETEAPEPTEDVTLTPEPTEEVTPTAEPTEDAKPSKNPTEEATPEPTKEAAPTAKPTPDGGAGGSGFSDEEAIKEIAEKGINAMMSGDAEGWYYYTDIEVLYYMAFGEMASEQEIIDELKDIMDDYADDDIGEIIVTSVKENKSAIQKFNDFLKSEYLIEEEGAPEDTSDQFKITGAYEVEMEVADGDYSESETLYVLKINGEWKLAYWLTFMSVFQEYFEEMSQWDY